MEVVRGHRRPLVVPREGGVRRDVGDCSLMSVPQPEDEEEEPALEELEQREVLVLGLDGSGKSTFLRMLSGKPPLEGHVPTWGFNSVRLPTKNFEVDLLESERGTPSLLPGPRFFGGVYKTHI